MEPMAFLNNAASKIIFEKQKTFLACTSYILPLEEVQNQNQADGNFF